MNKSNLSRGYHAVLTILDEAFPENRRTRRWYKPWTWRRK
jgi:hypothetical protein